MLFMLILFLIVVAVLTIIIYTQSKKIKDIANLQKDAYMAGCTEAWMYTQMSLYDMYINYELLDYTSIIVSMEDKINKLATDDTYRETVMSLFQSEMTKPNTFNGVVYKNDNHN